MKKLYRYEFRECNYDESRAQLQVEGRPVPLALRQRKLLSVLLASATRVVSRDELLDAVWGHGNSTVVDHSLTAAIDRLRKALGADGVLVRTIHGQGYRFDLLPSRRVVGVEAQPAPSASSAQPLDLGIPVAWGDTQRVV